MKKLSEIDKQIEDNKKNMEILPTGLHAVDAYLDGGFVKKELVVLGAKTGGGKSLFGAQIFRNIAKKGYKCAYFSLEISNEVLVSRLIGGESNVAPARITMQFLTEDEQKKKQQAKAKLSVHEEFMHFYDDLYELPRIVKAISEGGYDFVVIDFIQNILLSGKSDEYERLSQIALQLQKLAKDKNVCILVLSQLSNQMVREGVRKKDLVEYKGSGSIGTVCDLGFFIEDGDRPDRKVLRLRKNRRGISGGEFNFELRSPGGLIVDM